MSFPEPGNTIYPLTFREFQNHARLYVIGALNAEELAEFNRAAAAFGSRAQRFINDCCALRDAFALSLRPARATKAMQDRLGSMLRSRDQARDQKTPRVRP